MEFVVDNRNLTPWYTSIYSIIGTSWL